MQVTHIMKQFVGCFFLCFFQSMLLADANSLSISQPLMPKPAFWQAKTLLVFGDSLSDSNGDSFKHSDNAPSTYNLLRTLKGQKVDGDFPLDLAQFFSQAVSIKNIKATFALYRTELLSEKKEQHFFRRIMNGIESILLEPLEWGIIELVNYLEQENITESDELIGVIENTAKLLTKIKASFIARNSELISSVTNLFINKIEALRMLVFNIKDEGLTGVTETTIIAGTTLFSDQIPLLPDDRYYEKGKWTTGKSMDLMWPEVLVKMMSFDDNPEVKLDNRAMAGSWVLCAESKLGRPSNLIASVEGVFDALTTLFQGSLIPPCEGLIVQAYLNEQREKSTLTENKLIDPDTLVVFFNGGNDFLNNWADPDSIAQEQAQDIYTVLVSGAKRVIVFMLPDISVAPRYLHSASKKLIHQQWQHYTASLSMRINLLRETFTDYLGYQIMKIDAEAIFNDLRKDPMWDLENPILAIPIPGVDDADAKEKHRNDTLVLNRQKAQQQHNYINQELLSNAVFDDSWQSISGHYANVQPGKTAFFSDSVHLSAEAHFAVAEVVCDKLKNDFNIGCDSNNFTKDQAIKEATFRKQFKNF